MQRLSIARSLRLALVGLTVALAIVAALGLASLYNARQRYENVLEQSSALSNAAANLSAAAVGEDEALRDARGPAGAASRQQATSAYLAAAASATSLARADPVSAGLLRAEIADQNLARRLDASSRRQAAIASDSQSAKARLLAAGLQARQHDRQEAARSRARSDSRRAILLVAIAGLLALAGAVALITALVAAMREPLDELVQATRSLASGELERRVRATGPRELRQLGTAFNAMGSDLSDAQRRIEEERRRLAVTIESLGDAVIVTEPGSSRVSTVNPRATELVPELAVGGHVDAEESPLPPLDSALGAETMIEHRDRTLAVTAAPLGSEGDGIVWTLHDMSERARLERAKSEFVATASHELRSPLTSIKGFVELLERSPEGMSERQREFVDIILKSADRLVDLVNDLLDVARIEADHVEINRRPIDVGETVREVTELMGPRFAQKDQHLGVYIAPTLPLALADPTRVRQIVANLLTNAHLYTGEGGRIHVGVEPERAWVQIVVEDSGVGMTEDEAERVFERFYRGRDGGASSPGSGLGLSIVKSLVDLHHGQIEVDSKLGQGTAFTVMLPAAVPGPESGRPLEAIRGRRVLVVDDEPEIAGLIAGQLAPMDVQTTVVTTGQGALARLRAEHYDAVTLDILMPEMDGFEVLAQIRADPELRTTPIVFVSVFSGRSELAGEWVVPKPIESDELLQVLGAAVRAGRSRVLVVGRKRLQPMLESSLDELGIEHQWELTGAAAGRVSRERRFEVALVDVGVRNPQAVLEAIELRGRRLRRALILYSDETTPAPAGIERLGMEVVSVEEAPAAVLSALRGDRDA